MHRGIIAVGLAVALETAAPALAGPVHPWYWTPASEGTESTVYGVYGFNGTSGQDVGMREESEQDSPGSIAGGAKPAVDARGVFNTNPVPEPASLALIGAGLVVSALVRRRR